MKIKDFSAITSDVMTVVEFVTELLVGWHVYVVTQQPFFGILSWLLLTFIYAGSIIVYTGKVDNTEETVKKATETLKPFWLVFNTAICAVLSFI